jgi:hypothetical protein
MVRAQLPFSVTKSAMVGVLYRLAVIAPEMDRRIGTNLGESQ